MNSLLLIFVNCINFFPNSLWITNMETDLLCKQFEKSSEGLYYISESDYPFKILVWKNKNVPVINFPKLLKTSPEVNIEKTTLPYFFRNIAFAKDWHDESQKQQVNRFRAFLSLIEENLNDIQVFRIGKIEIDCYIVGRYNNDMIAIHTKSIET